MESNESNLFINEFLMGLMAQEYVERGLAIIQKVNRKLVSEL